MKLIYQEKIMIVKITHLMKIIANVKSYLKNINKNINKISFIKISFNHYNSSLSFSSSNPNKILIKKISNKNYMSKNYINNNKYMKMK